MSNLKGIYVSFESDRSVWLIDDVEMKYMRIPKDEKLDHPNVPYEGEWVPFTKITVRYVPRTDEYSVVVHAERPITTWAMKGTKFPDSPAIMEI